MTEENQISNSSIGARLKALLENEQVKNTSNTLSFVKSLSSQFDRKGQLSLNQIQCISRMESKYDNESVENKKCEDKEWFDEYDSTKKVLACKVANYYKTCYEQGGTFYYQNLCEKILKQPNYIPSRKEFFSLVENKFSKRFIKNTETPCSFKPGQLVSLNTYGAQLYRNEKNKSGIVISILPPTRNRARSYEICVLFFGKSTITRVEERFLKRFKQ